MTQKKTFILLVIILMAGEMTDLHSQVVYQDVNNKAIYEFLDEMANAKIIRINSVVKPYSRKFIAEKLTEIKEAESQLNKRQNYELHFYLKDYLKELEPSNYSNKRFDILYYKDSVFTFSLNGILGGRGWVNSNGFNYQRWFGADAFSYMGEHFGMYASLRDNTEKIQLADTGYINLFQGGSYHLNDYSEMRGGITWGWKWGEVALVKEHIEWGNSYRYPNIISSKAPSFAQFRIHLKPADWFEFNYVHGWLVSGVVDSSRSYNYQGIQRDVYHSKYIAANIFTFIPWKRLNLSIGNSIIYSDQYPNPAYALPFYFFKSVDHTYNNRTNTGGQNSAMFLDISNRLIMNVHTYYSMFIDVMSFGSVFDKERHANHWSMLGGIRYSNLLPNTSLTLEYVRNNALVYKNDNITTLYNSNWYNLGHYLGDNAQEVYFAIDFKPWNTLFVKAWLSWSQKGPDIIYDRSPDSITGIPLADGNSFLESVEWQKNLIGVRVEYQMVNDLFFFMEVEKQNMKGNGERYASPYFQGDMVSFSFGTNFCF